MENTKSNTSTDKLEVVQMFRVDSRVWVDLKRVIVVGRVLEQTVERVEHLVREQEEEFSLELSALPLMEPCNSVSLPRETSVIETVFTLELDHQPLLEVVRALSHNFGVRSLKDVFSRHLDVTLTSI